MSERLSKRVGVRLLPLVLSSIFAMSGAYAQTTSASLGGVVTDASGQPVSGAEVLITHSASGTVSRAATDAAGRYAARGLRVGGPYTITITRGGETEVRENVFLQLGEANTVSATLSATEQLEEVVVTGSATNSVFSAENMGTGTNLSLAQIEALPSIGRNIQDYMRLDPRISQVSKADGAISAMGQNTRFNAIRIDGVSTNDPFGLESNNLPTERQPVSMDAIEEINIGLANYDVTTSGGTGAVVNAVTKSGTNEFHGSVYGLYRDHNMVGEDRNGRDFTGFKDEKTYGFTLGGPIVKDKLFFFLNYEKFKRRAPGPDLLNSPFGTGAISAEDIAEVQRIARDVWGFDAGSLDGVNSLGTDIEEYAGKIDWNINENHRASFRYSKMDQNVAKLPGFSNNQISLNSYWYNQAKTFESYVGELFSDWSDVFSTEIKVSYRDYESIREPNSYLPHIRVDFGNQQLLFGTEQNTHVNAVQTKEKSAFFAGNLFLGDHTVKFGFDWSNNDIFNFYGRNLNGVYRFGSLELFEQGIPREYAYRAPRPGGSLADIPAAYELANNALFVQDSWAVNYNLNLTFGVRVDKPDFKGTPLYNARIQQLYGYDNTHLPEKEVIQPRFGFNYSFDSDRPTQVRGGMGLFMGAPPNVWLAGVYQNTGLNYLEYTENNSGGLGPIFSPDPRNQPISGNVGARQNVDIIDPNFKMPSVWKANVALDHELPWNGIVASVEFLAYWNKDGLYFERLDLGAPTATGPDGRTIYWSSAALDPANWTCSSCLGSPSSGFARANRPSDIGDVMLAKNTDKGGGNQITLSLAQPMNDGGWSWMAAYTHTQAKEVSPLTSSQNTSNWNNTLIYQANENVAYDSRYAFKHRVTGVLTKEFNFFGDNKTIASLVYEGRTGRPYSYVFWNDVNGDGRSFNDLFYVPSGPGDVIFSNPAEEAAFFEWLADHPEVARYGGRVMPANAMRAGWLNMFDLRFSQELPGFFDGHKAEFWFDIMNVGNLLNKKWGQIDDAGFNSNLAVANFAGIDPETGRYVYRFTGAQRLTTQEVNGDGVNTGVSRWSLQVGFRYRF
ncbi:TonB-dependent receptor [Dokdonella sp.]|uniref:TonB-dependent receptor n=1 Tax=Dokdonella sp. TaxID=2291710 RepID=UPI0039C8988B